MKPAPLLLALLLAAALPAAGAERVVVGSKAFGESWVLGEAAAILARETGAAAEHRSNLGGTEIVFQALESGSIDLYPEYTGTIAEVILKSPGHPPLEALRAAVEARGLGIGAPLGFNDGYALAITRAAQQRLGIRKISDLARHPELSLGLTHEFLGREDGWKGLARRYDLRLPKVLGLQHELAYEAIATGRIDVMDIYTTDAQIQKLGLAILEDDRGFFPRYDAVFLYRLDLPKRAPRAWAAIRSLEGRIDEARMIRANGRVALEKKSFQEAAAALLEEALGRRAGGAAPRAGRPGVPASILRNTGRHLELVASSLLLAILVGLPLGILATRSRLLAGLTLSVAGLLQTIPSLALLAFLILYSLLPIVRNTYVGLTTIPRELRESSEALGLSGRARLFRVNLPMATPAIMAGIKTSAVINVGTATLAALIGAGGLGEPILSGIQLRDHGLILQGAVPAAALALLVQGLFDLLDRTIIPRGLRIPASRG